MNRKLNIIYAAPNRRRERRNNMKLKKLASLALAGALTLGLMPGMTMTALADGDTSYTLTIPSELTVANSGWNATSGISATGTLASGKKLTVTASSANSFKLKSGDNSVGYKLATASTDTEATTSWTFDSLSSTATKKDMGIIVEDYNSKPAGTYQDTVTFTAKVEDAKPEYYNKLTKINDDEMDQVGKLKSLGRGYESYNSSLTAAQAYALATYQAAIDGKPVYVIMSSQNHGYEIHYAVSTDASATEHTADLYDICNGRNRMYYIAQ